MKNKSRTIGILGEAMGEIVIQQSAIAKVGVGGDTFNAAVYISQLPSNVTPLYFSAIGQDSFSQLFLERCEDFNLTTEHVSIDTSRNLGIYCIKNDADGERQFSYWRNDSAAKYFINNFSASDNFGKWLSNDAVLLSGICLAISSISERSQLISSLADWQRGTVYFDDNYRSTLWDKSEDVSYWYHEMFKAADVLFLSKEDQMEIHGLIDDSELLKVLLAFENKIIVLRDGCNPVQLIENGKINSFIVTPVIAKDTTAAGDSFSGAFIALKETGVENEVALRYACDVSAYVIQHQGALIKLPESLLNDFVRGDQ